MKFSTLLAFAALALSQLAFGQIEILERSVETAPTNINFPSSASGAVVFKPCSETCEEPYIRVILGGATSYRLNGESVKFADFWKGFTQRKNNVGAYALVTYDVESKSVIAIDFAD